jgi:hypothetical protein
MGGITRVRRKIERGRTLGWILISSGFSDRGLRWPWIVKGGRIECGRRLFPEVVRRECMNLRSEIGGGLERDERSRGRGVTSG